MLMGSYYLIITNIKKEKSPYHGTELRVTLNHIGCGYHLQFCRPAPFIHSARKNASLFNTQKYCSLANNSDGSVGRFHPFL